MKLTRWNPKDAEHNDYLSAMEAFIRECDRRQVPFKPTLAGLMRGWVEAERSETCRYTQTPQTCGTPRA